MFQKVETAVFEIWMNKTLTWKMKARDIFKYISTCCKTIKCLRDKLKQPRYIKFCRREVFPIRKQLWWHGTDHLKNLTTKHKTCSPFSQRIDKYILLEIGVTCINNKFLPVVNQLLAQNRQYRFSTDDFQRLCWAMIGSIGVTTNVQYSERLQTVSLSIIVIGQDSDKLHTCKHAQTCNKFLINTARNATGLLQVVDFTGLLQVVNKL